MSSSRKAQITLSVLGILTLLGAFAVGVSEIERQRVNVHKKRAEAIIATLWESELNVRHARQARELLRTAEQSLRAFPYDVDLYMEVAALQLYFGDIRGARGTYRRALEIEQRPEIYVAIARTSKAMGDLPGAREAMARATSFSPSYIPSDLLDSVSD